MLNYNNIDTIVNNRRDIDTINRKVSCGKILSSQIWGWAERDKNIFTFSGVYTPLNVKFKVVILTLTYTNFNNTIEGLLASSYTSIFKTVSILWYKTNNEIVNGRENCHNMHHKINWSANSKPIQKYQSKLWRNDTKQKEMTQLRVVKCGLLHNYCHPETTITGQSSVERYRPLRGS